MKTLGLLSVPYAKQTASATIAQKALAYGMAGIQVDGNDILAVYAAAKEAVDRARAGQGPTLIECVTYRMSVHTTADDPKRYRPDEEVESWRRKDPITRFEIYLQRRRLLTKAKIAAIAQEVRKEIQTAVDAAEAKMKTIGDPLGQLGVVQGPHHRSGQVARMRFQETADPVAAGTVSRVAKRAVLLVQRQALERQRRHAGVLAAADLHQPRAGHGRQ